MAYKQECGTKRRYLNNRDAAQGLFDVLNANPNDLDYNIYRCPYCHYFHYGRLRVKD